MCALSRGSCSCGDAMRCDAMRLRVTAPSSDAVFHASSCSMFSESAASARRGASVSLSGSGSWSSAGWSSAMSSSASASSLSQLRVMSSLALRPDALHSLHLKNFGSFLSDSDIQPVLDKHENTLVELSLAGTDCVAPQIRSPLLAILDLTKCKKVTVTRERMGWDGMQCDDVM